MSNDPTEEPIDPDLLLSAILKLVERFNARGLHIGEQTDLVAYIEAMHRYLVAGGLYPTAWAGPRGEGDPVRPVHILPPL